jgi:pimeloyl-ACP methyl ester carboxylesterase
VSRVLESRFADAAGVRLHYIEAGSGEPAIVLLHGLGSTVAKWRDALPMIATRRRAVAVDLPGFGKSEAPRARYTFGFLAGGIRAFLDAMGIERCVLVGNSLGGTAAMWLATAWPERVEGLVLVDAALPLPREARPDPKTIARMALVSVPGAGEALYSLFVRFKSAEWQVADGLRRNVADPGRLSAETMRLMHEEAEERRHRPELRRPLLSAQRNLLWMLSARRAEVERVAASLSVPTLLVWGSDDLLVPLVVGEEWVAKIPGAELVVLEGAGHNPQMELPDRFAEIVLAFSERLGAGVVTAPSGTPGSRG